MDKILGLDLGSSSIGWALINENEDSISIQDIGVRIIPLSVDDANEFSKGNAISKNANRTKDRTQRKGYDRYQMRRENLTSFLRVNNMLPGEALIKLNKISLWKLRADAVSRQLSLPEIGRVLYHINQKRGYKSAREDNSDKAQREYVEKIMSRYNAIKEKNVTIGMLFFQELSKNSSYRTKEQVFPRVAYMEEFDRIVECQRKFYPQIFNDHNINELRNRIIFYQRQLKSCKHLVSICDFEKREYCKKDGKIVVSGPKVAPVSSPLAQVCKIWESVNNITLKNRRGEKLEITPDQRYQIFLHLDNNEKLTLTDLYKILGISKSDGWWAGKSIGKGIIGNKTKNSIRKALDGSYKDLLRFTLSCKDTDKVDEETGEITQIISEDYMKEPLYVLWHLIYSIKEKGELANILKKQYNISDSKIIDNLYALDFVKAGYTNKSTKAMRRILPYLQYGLKYSESCMAAGFRHSESLTKEENENRELKSSLKMIEKNELRQPVVEKVLNQMINVVNALMEKHGRFDEIRIELARELKQSKEERNETFNNIAKAERLNKSIAESINEINTNNKDNLTPTRSRIQKYKMWKESDNKCFYCGQNVSVKEFLKGFDVEVEHIIPKSLFFDDSFSNKVCACRKCNHDKGKMTAYDFMKSKSEADFNSYIDRIEKMYKCKKISKTKYERLLTPFDKIPTDFIDRQLRESQYIAKKAREILSQVCRNVTTTSGAVTSFIRHIWGWDKVLHNLNFDRYKAAGLTQILTREHKGVTYNEEVIIDWSKRLDHRHHAIDALAIACTKQGYIQRINNMSQLKDESFGSNEMQGKQFQDRKTKLEKYILSQPHFSTSDVKNAIDSILISFKAGKKATSTGYRYGIIKGKRVKKQENIIIPRGALHEESIYGSILRYSKNSKGETVESKQIVIKYPLTAIAKKDVDSVVDEGIKRLVKQRFDTFESKDKDVLKDLADNPILFNGQPIKSVRCFTGLKNDSTLNIDRGIVKLGNNHHIDLYIDKDGKCREHFVTFWDAVKRKIYGIPIIITNPAEIWDNLSEYIDENLPEEERETIMASLPLPDWRLDISLQQNEMFILGMDKSECEEALAVKDYATLSKYLYRVQSVSSNDYLFRYHLETINDKTPEGRLAKKYHRFKSVKAFNDSNPIKVRISLLGEITKI